MILLCGGQAWWGVVGTRATRVADGGSLVRRPVRSVLRVYAVCACVCTCEYA